MEKTVEVISLNDKTIDVKIIRDAACSSCKTIHLCNNHKEEVLKIKNPSFKVTLGDRLTIKTSNYMILLTSFLQFLLPTIIFISIILLTTKKKELTQATIAFLVVLIYYIFLRIVIKKSQLERTQIIKKDDTAIKSV